MSTIVILLGAELNSEIENQAAQKVHHEGQRQLTNGQSAVGSFCIVNRRHRSTILMYAGSLEGTRALGGVDTSGSTERWLRE